MNEALVIALVRAHLMQDTSTNYVKAHTRTRIVGKDVYFQYVQAHTRREALHKKAIDSLNCVCKQPDIGINPIDMPPVGKKRRPKTDTGFKVRWGNVGGQYTAYIDLT